MASASKKIVLYSCIFYIATLFYFAFYYYFLSVSFSFLSFIFTTLLVFSWATFCQFFHTKIWLGLQFFLFFLFLVYCLINYAYFDVFHTFLTQETAGHRILDFNVMFPLLKGFYLDIPIFIYSITVALFTVFIFTTIRLRKKPQHILLFCGHPTKSYRQKKNNWAILGFFVFFNLSSFFLVQYFHTYPLESWWQNKQFFIDHGIAGHLYHQTASPFWRDDVVLAKTKQEEGGGMTIKKELTDFDKIKLRISSLAGTHQDSGQTALPVFQEKPHVIIYQLESVSSWVEGANPNPLEYFSKISKQNIHVNNFFASGCHTIDAEFAAMCSFFPVSMGPISDFGSDNNYHCLPSILQERYNYKTSILHSHVPEFWNRKVLAKKWGFEDLYFEPFYKQKQPDVDLIDDVIEKIESSSEPTFNYLIGFTSHSQHNPEHAELLKERFNFDIEVYEGEVNADILAESELDEYAIKYYLSFVQKIDQAIEYLFSSLEKEDLLDNTIVVIYGDHRYYNFPKTTKENIYYYNEIPFMMYVPGLGGVKVQDVAAHIDIAPTLLHLIEGVDYQKPEYFVGNDLFSEGHPNHAFTKCLDSALLMRNDSIWMGNTKIDLYGQVDVDNNISNIEDKKQEEILKELVESSDDMVLEDRITE